MALKKVKLAKIFINSDYRGEPLKNKKGEPYKMAVIENADGKKASMYIGMFAGAWDKKLDIVSAWKAGDEVEVSLEQKGEYLNFSLPTNEDRLEARVEALEKAVFKAPSSIPTPKPVSVAPNYLETPTMPDFEPTESDVSVDDIPF